MGIACIYSQAHIHIHRHKHTYLVLLSFIREVILRKLLLGPWAKTAVNHYSLKMVSLCLLL